MIGLSGLLQTSCQASFGLCLLDGSRIDKLEAVNILYDVRISRHAHERAETRQGLKGRTEL